RAVSTLVALAFCVTWAAPAFALLKCVADSVKVGNVCVDKYEASVWLIPPSSTALVKKVQAGKATLADLTGGGATQLSSSTAVFGCGGAPYPANFPASGQWTPVLGS